MLYVLLLPLLFIAILLSRFFDRMDEKIHIRTILAWIFSPYCPIYRLAMDSEKDFWKETFIIHTLKLSIINCQLSILLYICPFKTFSLFTKIYGKRNPTNEAVQSDKKQIS